MGRSFTSVRLGVRSLAERWGRTAGRLDRDDKGPAGTLTVMAKSHSSEAFYGCDNPLEAAVFSALLGIRGEGAREEERGDRDSVYRNCAGDHEEP
jgi:hypothetical protein